MSSSRRERFVLFTLLVFVYRRAGVRNFDARFVNRFNSFVDILQSKDQGSGWSKLFSRVVTTIVGEETSSTVPKKPTQVHQTPHAVTGGLHGTSVPTMNNYPTANNYATKPPVAGPTTFQPTGLFNPLNPTPTTKPETFNPPKPVVKQEEPSNFDTPQVSLDTPTGNTNTTSDPFGFDEPNPPSTPQPKEEAEEDKSSSSSSKKEKKEGMFGWIWNSFKRPKSIDLGTNQSMTFSKKHNMWIPPVSFNYYSIFYTFFFNLHL